MTDIEARFYSGLNATKILFHASWDAVNDWTMVSSSRGEGVDIET